jgi:sporulation protein YlmC with PRC-barrel domain
MNRLAAGSVAALLIVTPAVGQQSSKILSNVPGQSVTVTDWYKQSVYDASNSKIGDVRDVLLSADGKVSAVIVGVGGFLGMGEKDVAVPFDAIKHTTRDGRVYLTMNATKDELKAAPGMRYDRNATTWMPDTGEGNRTGTSPKTNMGK